MTADDREAAIEILRCAADMVEMSITDDLIFAIHDAAVRVYGTIAISRGSVVERILDLAIDAWKPPDVLTPASQLTELLEAAQQLEEMETP